MNVTNRALNETVATIRAQLTAAEQSVQAHTAKLNQALGKRRALSRALRAAERAIERDTATDVAPPEDQPRLIFPPIHGTVAGIAKAWLANQTARYSSGAADNEALNEVLTASWHALDCALIETPVVSLADALGLIQVAVKDFELQHSISGPLELPDNEHRILWAALNAAQKWLAEGAPAEPLDGGHGWKNPADNKRRAQAVQSLESRICDLRYAATLMQTVAFECDFGSAASNEEETRTLNSASFSIHQVADRVEGLVKAFYAALDGKPDDAYHNGLAGRDDSIASEGKAEVA